MAFAICMDTCGEDCNHTAQCCIGYVRSCIKMQPVLCHRSS